MWQQYIKYDEHKSASRPVIKRNGADVELVIRRMDSRKTIDELMLNFPDLTRSELLACISFSMRHYTISP